MKKGVSIFAHTKKVFFTTYGRVVAILIVSVVATFLIGVCLTSGLFYYVTGLNYFTPHFFSVFTEMSSYAPWLVPLGIAVSVLATLLVLLITFITSATTAFVLIRNRPLLESLKFGLTKGLRSVPVQVLFFVLLFASSVPSILLILLASVMADGGFAVLCVLLGLFLLLLPLLIGLRSIFAVFIWLENQKLKAMDIVKKSFTLTRGPVVWMMVLAVVIIGTGAVVIQPILALVLSEIAILILPFLLSGDVLFTITDQITSIFLFMPIMYAVFYTRCMCMQKSNLLG